MCYSELTPYALQKRSVLTVENLRWLQEQDDDEGKSQTAAGI